MLAAFALALERRLLIPPATLSLETWCGRLCLTHRPSPPFSGRPWFGLWMLLHRRPWPLRASLGSHYGWRLDAHGNGPGCAHWNGPTLLRWAVAGLWPDRNATAEAPCVGPRGAIACAAA